MICVLVLAAGHRWEAGALGHLEDHPTTTVLKRCVDVDDLMATATTGQADVSVVALDAPGLDPAAVSHLRRHGLRLVLVANGPAGDTDAAEHARRLGADSVVPAGALDTLPAAVLSAEGATDTRPRVEAVVPPAVPAGLVPAPRPARGAGGLEERRTLAVWGPAGAPGRTTVAVNLAAELARRGRPVVLADLDPYGGSIAQQLGILDEVSGVLAGARLAASAHLDGQFASVCRGVGERLSVLTGLPRADRWREVRPAHVEQMLEGAVGLGDVVVDCGFALEDDAADLGGRHGRNAMTLTALEAADEVVVVGSADPVGLARLARGLVDLAGRVEGTPLRVVVNRMRPSIGWSEREVARMVEGFAKAAGLHFLPDDGPAVDRALVSGRPVAWAADGALSQAVASLADAVFPASAGAVRRRRAGRALRR